MAQKLCLHIAMATQPPTNPHPPPEILHPQGAKEVNQRAEGKISAFNRLHFHLIDRKNQQLNFRYLDDVSTSTDFSSVLLAELTALEILEATLRDQDISLYSSRYRRGM